MGREGEVEVPGEAGQADEDLRVLPLEFFAV